MAIWDNLKNAIKTYDDDDYIENEDRMQDGFSFRGEKQEETEYAEPKAKLGMFSRREAKFAFAVSSEPAEKSMLIIDAVSFDQATEIADNLKANRSVLLNLETADNATGRRLLDFLSGVVYGLGGNIKKSSSKTVVLTPTSVTVVGDEGMDFENSGISF